MSVLVKIRCTQESLNFIRKPPLAAGDVQATRVQFVFCDSWKGFMKTAIFARKNEKPYYMILKNDECTIPKEVLALRGTFYISVIGDRDGVRLTSDRLTYNINPSLATEDALPAEPTPDVYAQIMNILNEKADNIVYNAEDSTIQLSANGMPVGNRIKVGVGEGGNSIVNIEINANGELIAMYADGTTILVGKVQQDCTCPGIYVPSKEGDKLIFTLQDTATEERIEMDIDPTNEWNTLDKQGETNYVWNVL